MEQFQKRIDIDKITYNRERETMNHLQRPTLWRLLKKVHNDERGAVSIETILVAAVIAIPILIFILKFGWPKIREIFETGLEDLEGASSDVTDPAAGS